MRIYSFDVSADFAVFRDPSITTNKTTYLVPSKSIIVGLLASMIGVPRAKNGSALYSKEFLEFFSSTKVGLRANQSDANPPQRMVLYTNHRSLNKAITKPVKGEVLIGPSYRVFFSTTNRYELEFDKCLPGNKFVYTPYLGHAYCLARISNFNCHEAKRIDAADEIKTSAVFLSKEFSGKERTRIATEFGGKKGKLFIERHLHHYFEDGKLRKEVVRYYIPINAPVEFRADLNSRVEGTEFVDTSEGQISLF